MPRAFATALAMSLAVAVLTAQDLPSKGESHERMTKDTAHLTITTSTSPDVADPHTVSLIVDVVPKPKMHVYAPGQEGYIAVALTLDADPAFTAAKPKYPAGEKMFVKVLNETQLVYTKPFRITQDITLRSGTEQTSSGEGSLTVKGTFRYQACDDKVCYLPMSVPITWTVKPAASR